MSADGLERIWTPHRMEYIRADPITDGCPFCSILERGDDELTVAEGRHTYVVLNLHPYNPGHLMVVPNRHVGDLGELASEEAAEMMWQTQKALKVLGDVSNACAFNIGMNLGAPAGGSVTDHLHQHIVPRWEGDVNFFTVIGGVRQLPELLETTRELLRTAWSTGA